MPVLSVLIPYYSHDPAPLLEALLAQATPDVEILLYDDGTADAAVNARLSAIAKTASAPVHLNFAPVNKGRSAARNALFANAKSPWVLFLDADMLPADDRFLERYLDAVKTGDAEVIFGGFQMAEEFTKDTALHHAFSNTSDCLSAAERDVMGPKYVCSSNLAVQSDVLSSEPFDTGFSGWGWEDSEWAARVADKFTLKHLENPALHLGLEGTQVMLSRFKSSAANYMRFTDKHPKLAPNLTLYKMMHKLTNLPGKTMALPLIGAVAASGFMPMKLRLLALKLWRAGHYAIYLQKTTPAAAKPVEGCA